MQLKIHYETIIFKIILENLKFGRHISIRRSIENSF